MFMQEDGVAIFKNKNSGQLEERHYSQFYSLMPTTPNPLLSEAGLADSTGFLDVNEHTLQHKKYSNIFGVGDANNVPTTKTFYGGLSQVSVVRHNVERKLNGLSLNAKYDGHAKANMLVSPSNLVNVEHKYGGDEVSFSTDGLSTALKFKLYGKHGVENISKFKNWGPPYYKIKKSFEGGDAAAATPVSSVEPEKKTA
jgi:sulfide:quinone oxidoreductase